MSLVVGSGCRLALDPGSERIGIAISDELGLVASPLKVVPTNQIAAEVADILKDKNVIAIYLGLPRHLSGAEGSSAKAARELGERLARDFKIPVSLVDERLTTKSAATNSKAVQQHGIDAMAATEILNLALSGEKKLGRIFGEVVEI
jgi:putative Holliday junction resolvase